MQACFRILELRHRALCHSSLRCCLASRRALGQGFSSIQSGSSAVRWRNPATCRGDDKVPVPAGTMRGPKGLNEGLPFLLSQVFVQPFRTASPGASPPRRISIMSYSEIRPAMHLVSRERESHPNHHLTNNNGTWWCQITVHQGLFSRRLRFSLGTGDLERARLLRDRVFDNLSAGPQAA